MSQSAGQIQKPVDWPARMRKAALDAEAARQHWEDARELRDRLIVEGYDAGWSVADVARHALIARARVHQIVAGRG